MAGERAFLTFKYGLRRAIATRYVTATGAFTTSKSWVNVINQHSLSFSFIRNTLLESFETPAMESASLLFPSLRIASDIRKVFKNNCCTTVNRLYQSFRKYVVAITPKPSLSARYLFKMSFRGFCAFLLESSAQLKGFFCYILPVRVAIKVTSIVSSCIDFPQIYTNNFFCWFDFRGLSFFNYVQPPSTKSVSNQVSTSSFPILILTIIICYLEGKLNTSFNSCQRQLVPIPPYSVGASIVPNRTTSRVWKRYKLAFLLECLGAFNSFCGFNSCRADKLRRQIGNATMESISSIMQLNPIADVFVPSVVTDIIKSPSILLDSLGQDLGSSFSRCQLETDGCLHIQQVTTFIRNIDYLHLIVNHYTENGSPPTLHLAVKEG